MFVPVPSIESTASRRRHRRGGLGPWLILLAILLPAEGFAQPADDYEDTFARAAALEAAGDPAAVALLLESLIADYPQDYRLLLELGWLYFEAEDYPAADRAYRRAHQLSGGGAEPALGLAWTALRQKRWTEAETGFVTVLQRDPGNASASEGLQLCGDRSAALRPRLEPTLAATVISSGIAFDPPILGLTLALPVVIHDRLLLGLTYRHRFLRGGTTTSGAGPGSGLGGSASLGGEDELHVGLGLRWPAFELSVHAGRLFAGIDDLGPVNLGGFSARYSPFGDLLLEGSYSDYLDLDLLRFSLGWRTPAIGPLRLQPGMSLQAGNGELLPSGYLLLSHAGAKGSFWVGGKLGPELRPAYLYQPSVYALEERIAFGAFAGGQLKLDDRWRAGLELELHRLEAATELERDRFLTLVSLIVAHTL